MSTSLLYHGFGIRGYRYEKTEYVQGEIVFSISQVPFMMKYMQTKEPPPPPAD